MKRVLVSAAAILALGACSQPGYSSYGTKQQAGALLGGVGGAVAGAQFGSGSGQLVGTAIGTLLGAAIGSETGASLDRADALYYSRSVPQQVPPAYYSAPPTYYAPTHRYAPSWDYPGSYYGHSYGYYVR